MQKPPLPGALSLQALVDLAAARDYEGRPADEQNAPPGDDAYKKCPYSGSRVGGVMNVAALKQVTRNWDVMLSAIVGVRREYLRDRELERVAVGDMWTISIALNYLPRYLLDRAEAPFENDKLPPFITGLSKTARDLAKVPMSMMVRRDARAHVTADEVFDYADEDLHFLLPTEPERVCAGSKRQIVEFFTAMIDGTTDRTAGSEALETVVSDPHHFFEYVQCLSRFDLVTLALQHSVDCCLLDLPLEHGGLNDPNRFRMRRRGALAFASPESRAYLMVQLLDRARSATPRQDEWEALDAALSSPPDEEARCAALTEQVLDLVGNQAGSIVAAADVPALAERTVRCLRFVRRGLTALTLVQAMINRTLGRQENARAVSPDDLEWLVFTLRPPFEVLSEALGVSVDFNGQRSVVARDGYEVIIDRA
jgi:hypothetical protein